MNSPARTSSICSSPSRPFSPASYLSASKDGRGLGIGTKLGSLFHLRNGRKLEVGRRSSLYHDATIATHEEEVVEDEEITPRHEGIVSHSSKAVEVQISNEEKGSMTLAQVWKVEPEDSLLDSQQPGHQGRLQIVETPNYSALCERDGVLSKVSPEMELAVDAGARRSRLSHRSAVGSIFSEDLFDSEDEYLVADHSFSSIGRGSSSGAEVEVQAEDAGMADANDNIINNTINHSNEASLHANPTLSAPHNDNTHNPQHDDAPAHDARSLDAGHISTQDPPPYNSSPFSGLSGNPNSAVPPLIAQLEQPAFGDSKARTGRSSGNRRPLSAVLGAFKFGRWNRGTSEDNQDPEAAAHPRGPRDTSDVDQLILEGSVRGDCTKTTVSPVQPRPNSRRKCQLFAYLPFHEGLHS